MRRFSAQLLMALAVSLFGNAVSQADLILDLRYSDLSTSKTVASGSSVFVDLLLTDTDASTNLNAEGLLTGGGRLLQTLGTMTLTPGVITPNPGWDPLTINTNPTSSGGANEVAKFFAAADFLALNGVGQGLNSVVLATFQLVATGPAGATDTITADLLNAISGNATFTSFDDLDAVPPTFGPGVSLTLSAAAVPEPATVVLGSMSLCAAGAAAWRKRRAARKNSDAAA